MKYFLFSITVTTWDALLLDQNEKLKKETSINREYSGDKDKSGTQIPKKLDLARKCKGTRTDSFLVH